MSNDDDSSTDRRSELRSAEAAADAFDLEEGAAVRSLSQADTGKSDDSSFDRTEVVSTACAPNCRGKCPIDVYVRDGRVEFVEPQMPEDEQYRRACLLGQSNVQQVYSPNRLKYPMVRSDWSPGDPNPESRGQDAEFQQVSWDEALEYVSGEMSRVQEQYGPQSVLVHVGSGDYGRNAQWGQRFAWQIGATQMDWSIDTNLGPGFRRVTGYGDFLPPANEAEDWVNAETIVAWGTDLFESQFQGNSSHVLDAIEDGARLVVVDPVYTTTAEKSDLWLPIKPGKDVYLALAMIDELFAEELYDEEFLRERTTAGVLIRDDTEEMLRMSDLEDGDEDDDRVVGLHAETGDPVALEADTYEHIELFGSHEVDGIQTTTALTLLEDHVADYSPEDVAEIADLDVDDVRTTIHWLANRGPGGIAASYGLGRYKYGNIFGQTYAILLALTGDYGRSGTIHAQHPWGARFYSGSYTFPEDGEGSAVVAMHDLPDAMENHDPFPIKAMYAFESNLLANQFPDRKLWLDALQEVDTIAVADIFHTPTVQHADIVLPAAHWFEREDITDGTAGHPHYTFRNKAHDPLWEARDDYDILDDLAGRLGHDELFLGDKRAELERVAEFDDRVEFDELVEKGTVRIDMDVVKYQDPFPTDTGRIEIYDEDHPTEDDGTVLDLPRPIEDRTADDHELAEEYPLLFMQKHSKWRINSQWANNAMVRKTNPEPVVDVHPSDAEERGIEDGEYVQVYNERGEVVVRARYNDGMRPGLINVDQGWWTDDFVAGHINDLTHTDVNDLAPTYAFYDVRTEVEPAPDVDASMYDSEREDWAGEFLERGDGQ